MTAFTLDVKSAVNASVRVWDDLINQKFTILKIIQELINEIKTGKNISKAISVEFLNYLLLMV